MGSSQSGPMGGPLGTGAGGAGGGLWQGESQKSQTRLINNNSIIMLLSQLMSFWQK